MADIHIYAEAELIYDEVIKESTELAISLARRNHHYQFQLRDKSKDKLLAFRKLILMTY